MSIVTADDRAAALGKLFRGIVHETANVLNVILMNAQLAEISEEDAAASISTIGDQARDGGEFLKQLSAFAGADNFSPISNATAAEGIALSRSLLGSTARRHGTKINIEQCDETPRPLDKIGVAVVVALLMDELCRQGAESIEVSTGVGDGSSLDINIKAVSADLCDKDESGSLALRLATALCHDHGGELTAASEGWRLRLSS